jgi:hypothetical protein
MPVGVLRNILLRSGGLVQSFAINRRSRCGSARLACTKLTLLPRGSTTSRTTDSEYLFQAEFFFHGAEIVSQHLYVREWSVKTLQPSGSPTSSGGRKGAAWLWLRSCRRIEEYDGLVFGELEYAMSASTSVPPPHRISILMFAAGRFLVCRDCELRLGFPAGARYDTIAKEFESHSCSSPIPSKDDAA